MRAQCGNCGESRGELVIMCGSCADDNHETWLARLAEKDRRIAELEGALEALLGAVDEYQGWLSVDAWVVSHMGIIKDARATLSTRMKSKE